MKQLWKLTMVSFGIAFVLMLSFLYEDKDFPKADKTMVAFLPKNPEIKNALPTPRSDIGERVLAEKSRDNSAQYAELEPFFELAPYHRFVKELRLETPLKKIYHYKFEQDGVPIVGMEFELEENAKGIKQVLSQSYRKIPEVDTNQNAIPAEEALRKAGLKPLGDAPANQIIYVEPGRQEGTLAVVTSFRDPRSKRTGEVVFNASNGQILARTYNRKF